MRLPLAKIIGIIAGIFLNFSSWSQNATITPVMVSDPKDFGGRVNCLLQDRTGYIWIGKETGLFQYDGYQVKTLRIGEDSTSLSNGNIQCIAEDKYGYIWIGTKGGGLNRYNKKTGVFRKFLHNSKNPASIAYNEIFSIFPDSYGNLWIGTDGGGLDYYNLQKGTFEHYNQCNSGLKSNKVLAIHPDKKGNLWLGTWGAGLHFMNIRTKTINYIRFNQRIPEINIFKIAEPENGKLMIATWGTGLLTYSTGPSNFSAIIPDFKQPHFRDIIFNPKTIFAASSDGLIEIDRKTGKYTTITDPVFRNISAVAIDKNGILWIGSESGSVGKINIEAKNFNSVPELFSNGISFLKPSEDGKKLMVASADRLIFLDPQTGIVKRVKVPYSNLISIGVTANEIILASSNGLSVMDRSNRISKIEFNDTVFANRQIWTIYKKSDTSFWIGSLGAASEIVKKNGRWKIENTFETGKPGSISLSHYPSCFIIDRNQNLWIGTYGGGLNVLRKGEDKFTSFTNDDNSEVKISDNFVECLLEDYRGRIWIGTHNGLDCYNQASYSVKSYNYAQGLQNTWIASLEQDRRGNLWVSTHGGISCIQNDSTIRNYDTADGLISNSYMPRSSAQLADGSLWFGSNNGLVWFYPDSIHISSVLPKVVITGLWINNRKIEAGSSQTLMQNIEEAKRIIVMHHDSFILEFSTLQYFNPKKNHYRYILKGFDKNWHISGGRIARYAGVSPGKYIFSVEASNQDGVWTNHLTSVEVIIKGSFPFSAVITFMTILILAVLGFYLRKRLKSKKITVEPPKTKQHRDIQPSEVVATSTEDVFFQKALKVVEENLSDPDFGVEEMCYKICISRAQLYRKIQAATGLSVIEFIREVRLKRAAQLLRQKPENISEIAYNVGFNDPKYFSKCFKQKFGMSPARYMRENERFLPPE